jgi:hypothetical protein
LDGPGKPSPGVLLAPGGDVARGESYHSSWAAALAQHKLPSEAINYTTLAALSDQYQLRPEYVDSALFLWLPTGKESYRDRGPAGAGQGRLEPVLPVNDATAPRPRR